MKPKIILCLALVLSGGFALSYAGETNLIESTNLLAVKIGSHYSIATNADKITAFDDVRMGTIKIPGLNDSIIFTEQPTQFSVHIAVATYRDDEKYSVPKVSELHRQLWLLQEDGTLISQSRKPVVIGAGNGGSITFYLAFTFQRKSTDEVAGIVTSVNGKLYCRELPKEWNKQ